MKPAHKPEVLPSDAVACPSCGFQIFDGTVIRSRVVHVKNGKALCRCKTMVSIPLLGCLKTA